MDEVFKGEGDIIAVNGLEIDKNIYIILTLMI